MPMLVYTSQLLLLTAVHLSMQCHFKAYFSTCAVMTVPNLDAILSTEPLDLNFVITTLADLRNFCIFGFSVVLLL